MPLKILEKSENHLVALWQISENSQFFETQLPKEDLDYINSNYSDKSTNEKLQAKQKEKKLERLAVRLLVKNLAEQMRFDYTFLKKTKTGKPFLAKKEGNKNLKLSISHDFPFCAAIIDKTNEVGIDIQSLTPKISRVFHRVMSQEEQSIAQNLKQQTLFWSSKEALYKYADIEGLFFKEDLNVKSITDYEKTQLFGRVKNDLISYEWLPLFHHYFENEEKEFVVVWL
ncbi:phosphopantetheinyl transferase [Bernardetia litoralis DSM 6794]|uniref:Phosphopantetheinyl transferase n=1 Tax=Bernardetia litoralis (strain ATCC 23117 / DSM 6794 / NBRC 15988 / NCIMB 1366 / Fx l1 / Sio-4) TaxID=880071 RepID=I4AGP8_BERLS|nr:4'-phosphopantetheinyl transferase superfamily protein [Bernardetia litoralis]AFM03133.1 phosphopantetheinyl transferase [Bernardetia litoralis DSM 6794]